jgi:hypothetical protein
MTPWMRAFGDRNGFPSYLPGQTGWARLDIVLEWHADERGHLASIHLEH